MAIGKTPDTFACPGIPQTHKKDPYLRRPCVVANYNTTFPVCLPAKIDNLVPTSQERFQKFRVIKRFCVEGSNKRNDCGALYVAGKLPQQKP